MSTDEAALGIGVLRDSGCCLRPPAKAGGTSAWVRPTLASWRKRGPRGSWLAAPAGRPSYRQKIEIAAS